MITQILQKALPIVACSGIFWSYYWLVLRHKPFHNWNRFYLIFSVLLPIAIPFISFTIGNATLQQLQNISLLPLAQSNHFEQNTIDQTLTNHWNWQSILATIYSVVTAFFAVRFSLGLLKIARLRFTNPTLPVNNSTLILVAEKSAPFSFFHWIFWKKDLALTTYEGQQILLHEQAHVSQWHSIDRILMEIVTIICWWNPIFWLAKKEIAVVQEFLADRQACPKNDLHNYSLLLLSNLFQTQFSVLTNPFFHSNIKRRLIMLTNQQKSKNQFLTRLAVIPTALIVIALFSFKAKKTNNQLPQSNKPITIVVDAGHGGIDQGAISANGVKEKDIALAIVQKIKAQAADRNITVVLTREGDELPIPGDKNASIKKRVEITKASKASLFLSVHISTAGEAGSSASGFYAQIQGVTKDNRLEKSRLLGSALMSELVPLGLPVNRTIHQTDWNSIYVLDKNVIPAVLLEAGFMSNPTDVAFLTSTANQEKIATAILDGVVKYSNQQP
jgi:N-acetylmuramoyl-L-alanine amidase